MQYLPVVKAIETVAGVRVSPPTATRWCTEGVQGVVLRSVLLGKRRLSTVEWVQAFIDARSQQPEPQPEADSTTRKKLEQELAR